MKKWDVFLSHASEDKEAVVVPLAESLMRAGLKVWLDQFELKVGDSLREKIDQGLSESRFGIVVLSENFLNKRWAKKELNGLYALEDDDRAKVILPIWHGVDKATITRFSPTLADLVAANTKDGISAVSRAIAEAILEAGRESGSQRLGLAAQLIGILEQGPRSVDISGFLDTYRAVLPAALGRFNDRHAKYVHVPDYGEASPDLTVRYQIFHYAHIEARVDLIFCPADDLTIENDVARGALALALERMKRLRRRSKVSRSKDRDFRGRTYFQFILAGRRDRLSDQARNGLRKLFTPDLEVRTYDWLIEACVAVEMTREAEEKAAREAREAAEKKAREIAPWVELALKTEIDPARAEAFIRSAESLLVSSPESLNSHLDIFVPRLLLHWEYDPSRAAAIITRLGREAVLIALQNAAILTSDIQSTLLRLIGELRLTSPAALDLLARCLASSDPKFRTESIVVAGRLGPAARSVVPVLLPSASVEDTRTRGLIASALGEIGDSSSGAISYLMNLLADQSALARFKAAFALEKIGRGAVAATPALEQCLKDESRVVREAAGRAIVAIGRSAIS